MNKENEIKNKSYSVLDTESLLIHNDERPKINLQTPHRNLAGRAQAEKSAVWHDGKGKHGFPRPLSFRKVSMRNIGAALYPAYRHCGMTNAARGFTLIELLVVVLIIGILAAVAVPQYQKAVEKSRSTQAISLVKSVYQAAETYYMEHGVWPSKFTDLDLDIPWTGKVKGWDTPGDTLSNDDWSLQIRTNMNLRGIFTVRLSGPYRGGMFVMYFDGVIGGQQRRLMCGELRTGDFNFQKNSGDFCNRVWQGKLLLEGNNTRLYSLNV